MKKRHLIWIIPCGLIMAAIVGFLISFYTSPVKFKKIYRNNSTAKPYVTEEEIEKDLAVMKYYFQYGYSGYDEAVLQGFDIDSAIEEIKDSCKKELKNDGKIESKVLSQKIYEVLNKELTLEDGHISIFGQNYNPPSYDNRLYLSDVYLRKGLYDYHVYKSDAAGLKPDTVYAGKKENLIEWYDGDEKVWRFGAISDKNLKNLAFTEKDDTILVPVKKNENLSFKDNWVNVRSTDKTLYISVSDFSLMSFKNSSKGFSNKFLQEFYDKIRSQIADKKNVILDLRNNCGGNGEIPAELLAAIFYYDFNEEDTKAAINALNYQICNEEFRIESPVTAQILLERRSSDRKEEKKIVKQRKENPDMEYFDISKNEAEKMEYNRETGMFLKMAVRPYYGKFYGYFNYDKTKDTEVKPSSFYGNFYVLVNHNSASASEYTIAEASLIKRASKNDFANFKRKFEFSLIGENTAGAVSYFNPCYLFLPNSGTGFYLPTAYGLAAAFKNENRYKGEGKGWYPEIWTTDDNLLNTLENLTEDEDLKKELKGLEKNLM